MKVTLDDIKLRPRLYKDKYDRYWIVFLDNYYNLKARSESNIKDLIHMLNNDSLIIITRSHINWLRDFNCLNPINIDYMNTPLGRLLYGYEDQIKNNRSTP